jgi:hypothetical protein
MEVVGFEDSVREIALRAVKATFHRIDSKRLVPTWILKVTSFWHAFFGKADHYCRGARRLYREALVEIRMCTVLPGNTNIRNCDPLRVSLRAISSMPVVHVNRTVMVLEPASDATL